MNKLIHFEDPSFENILTCRWISHSIFIECNSKNFKQTSKTKFEILRKFPKNLQKFKKPQTTPCATTKPNFLLSRFSISYCTKPRFSIQPIRKFRMILLKKVLIILFVVNPHFSIKQATTFKEKHFPSLRALKLFLLFRNRRNNV